MDEIVFPRVLLTDINVWKDASAVRKDHFANDALAETFVDVQRFLNPGQLVEIEADAIVAEDDCDRCAYCGSGDRLRR